MATMRRGAMGVASALLALCSRAGTDEVGSVGKGVIVVGGGGRVDTSLIRLPSPHHPRSPFCKV